MKKIIITTCALAAVIGIPVVAQAQSGGGAATGAVGGAVGGAIVGGPVGAAVGAGAGLVAGGIADDARPRFREYVVRERVPSIRYQEDVRVGARLPASARMYPVPREYGITKYRYTVVNDRPVLVDPQSRAIVQVIE